MSKLIIGGYEAMTVGELIAHLQQFPAETPVVYRFCSNYSPLLADEVEYAASTDGKYGLHGGEILKGWELRRAKDPQFIDVVVFPGN